MHIRQWLAQRWAVVASGAGSRSQLTLCQLQPDFDPIVGCDAFMGRDGRLGYEGPLLGTIVFVGTGMSEEAAHEWMKYYCCKAVLRGGLEAMSEQRIGMAFGHRADVRVLREAHTSRIVIEVLDDGGDFLARVRLELLDAQRFFKEASDKLGQP